MGLYMDSYVHEGNPPPAFSRHGSAHWLLNEEFMGGAYLRYLMKVPLTTRSFCPLITYFLARRFYFPFPSGVIPQAPAALVRLM